MMTHEEWQEKLVAWQEAVQQDHRLIPPYCLCDACTTGERKWALITWGPEGDPEDADNIISIVQGRETRLFGRSRRRAERL